MRLEGKPIGSGHTRPASSRSNPRRVGNPTFSAGSTTALGPESSGQSGQLEELVRILNAKPQQFRLQFFGVATERGPAIVMEKPLAAPDAQAAILAAASWSWPRDAIGLRILDREGCEIFEQLKADRR